MPSRIAIRQMINSVAPAAAIKWPVTLLERAAAFGVRVGDAEGVGRRAVAGDLAEDRRAAFFGPLKFLQDDHRRPFGQYKPVPVEIERPRRLLRLRVPLREGREQGEARYAERMD